MKTSRNGDKALRSGRFTTGEKAPILIRWELGCTQNQTRRSSIEKIPAPVENRTSVVRPHSHSLY